MKHLVPQYFTCTVLTPRQRLLHANYYFYLSKKGWCACQVQLSTVVNCSHKTTRNKTKPQECIETPVRGQFHSQIVDNEAASGYSRQDAGS